MGMSSQLSCRQLLPLRKCKISCKDRTTKHNQTNIINFLYYSTRFELFLEEKVKVIVAQFTSLSLLFRHQPSFIEFKVILLLGASACSKSN